jgi:hypothetical protein
LKGPGGRLDYPAQEKYFDRIQSAVAAARGARVVEHKTVQVYDHANSQNRPGREFQLATKSGQGCYITRFCLLDDFSERRVFFQDVESSTLAASSPTVQNFFNRFQITWRP